MHSRNPKRDGPGVPEALPQALSVIRDRLGSERVDALWLFPPLVKGRSERGLVVASCFDDGAGATEEEGTRPVAIEDRRLLHTLTYQAERTGRGGLSVEAELFEEGLAPEERVSVVIRGVVRRTEIELGDPRAVQIGGDADEFEKLLDELAPPPLDPVLS